MIGRAAVTDCRGAVSSNTNPKTFDPTCRAIASRVHVFYVEVKSKPAQLTILHRCERRVA
jgi:hypothetical protein